ncbi:hypothetical protein C4D60_Mb07t12380 [Musa balbisiana]|uniref:Prolyl 4-hydroxylase alpha subunit Fe(2+) 2OG dioxygenase domain-containing protein n=1 Tax=Musa balbisiana TaxID=52838 RepID=A0A4S8JF12_MUSBA|nr:hypothetical protein C4D60_Mb07t12380 [Musa balbisiana]
MERANECGYSAQQGNCKNREQDWLHGPSFQMVIPYDICTLRDFSSSLHLLNNSGDKQKMVNPFKYYATGMVRSTNRILTIFMIQRTKRLAAIDTPLCSLKPSKGDAVLFFSLHVNGTTDPASLHGSCPVIEGDKSFDYPLKPSSSKEYSDENELCYQWAAAG